MSSSSNGTSKTATRWLLLAAGASSRVARTIVSIAAAPGWAARFADDEGDKVVTLLAWALVEEGTSRNLVGLVQRPTIMEGPGWVVLADEVDGFDGYTPDPLPTRASK